MVPELPEKGASAEIVPVGKIEYFVTFPASAVAREGRRGVPRDAGKHTNPHLPLMYASSTPPPSVWKTLFRHAPVGLRTDSCFLGMMV